MRVPLEASEKHYTKEEILKKQLAEQSVFVGNEQLETPPDWLLGDEALNEWKRLVKEFSKKSMISNLDYNNLGAYCNAFVKWKTISKKLEFNLLVVGEVNPLVQLELKYADEMKKFGNLLGLSIESRLKKGQIFQEEGEENINIVLGDI